MKKLKKISLKKEQIVNLNQYEMNQLQGGTWSKVSEAITTWSLGHSLDYTIELTESILKDNTVWIGCTTDPERSKMYGGAPGCVG